MDHVVKQIKVVPVWKMEYVQNSTPNSFNKKTIQSQDGYPMYKRAENGVTIEKRC